MVSVSGIICPCNWDSQGNVMNVLVAADEEKDYYIEPTPLGKELNDYSGHRIYVQGILNTEDPRRTLEVQSFALSKL